MKKIVLVLILIFVNNLVWAPEYKIVNQRILYCRITVYNPNGRGEKKINHKGERITNSIGCAVPSNCWKDGTTIEILEFNIKRIVDDRIPRGSVNKHKRIAKKKGIDIDLVIDLRYNNIYGKKALYKKDLGYKWVKIYEKKN